MKTIAKFSKTEEAYLLCSRLEAAGIAAFVAHDHMATMLPVFQNMARVEVADEDEEAARALMAEDSE